MSDPLDLLTVDDLCKVLMVGKNTAYNLVTSNTIKSFKVGKSWKIPRASVEKYVQDQVKINNKKKK